MASQFLQTLLNAPYPTIFGNALTSAEAEAARQARNATNLDSYKQQYDNAQQALVNAATNLGSAQAAAAQPLTREQQLFEKLKKYGGLVYGMDMLADKISNNNATKNAVTDATSALESAQKAASRAFDQYQVAQQTAASRPESMRQAVNWGQLAQAAENNMINQAVNRAKNAMANEDARMATMSAHPLLGGGIR